MSVNPFDAFVDYIIDPGNVWDKTKYVNSRRVSGVTEDGAEFNFSYSYLLGNAYMEGTFGIDADVVILTYVRNQGFQISRKMGTGTEWREGFPPHQHDMVKQTLNIFASQ